MDAGVEATLNDWCHHPLNLWDVKTTELVVCKEWDKLKRHFFWSYDEYTSPGFILNQPKIKSNKKPLLPEGSQYQIYLEDYSDDINGFYYENGIVFDHGNSTHNHHTSKKLVDALELLDSIPDLMSSICLLIRTIGILKSEESSNDVSYSHPKLPFSIFISLCSDRSPISTARVAESILHEAMHLKLSLIQNSVDLLNLEYHKGKTYFAPWRKEMRPANGILHGIFVFRAIFDYFFRLEKITNNNDTKNYAQKRIKEIRKDILDMNYFSDSDDLNVLGKRLAKALLTVESN